MFSALAFLSAVEVAVAIRTECQASSGNNGYTFQRGKTILCHSSNVIMCYYSSSIQFDKEDATNACCSNLQNNGLTFLGI